MADNYFDPPPPDYAPTSEVPEKPWFPRLNRIQQKIFDDPSKYVLAYGEKGSGKTWSCISSLVRHCYEEKDALALILAPSKRTGKEGVMYDLEYVLDIWRFGNKAKDDDEERIDSGIGLSYTEPKLDPNTKDQIIWIGNKHGGWSKVMLISIPYAEVVQTRMKGLSPSFVYADEITELDSVDYFKYVVQQLNRRRHIVGPQQYVASCNPEGPSHWVYDVWFVNCIDPEAGERDPDFSVHHVPSSENVYLKAGYFDGLEKIYRDPIEKARLIEGRWIDRPSGEAIFKNYWLPEIHVRPTPMSEDDKRGFVLSPKPGFPIITGWDPGPRNYCVTFLQMIPCVDKVLWIVFDELNLVGEFTPDFMVVPKVLAKMDYWQTFLGIQTKFFHVAPADAFNQRRQDGSYDATRVQQLSKNRIRLRECPQARQSVPQRVQMIISMLLANTLYVSAKCQRTMEMFRLLASEKPKEGKYDPNIALTPKRSPYLHPFDSLSYAPMYFSLNPGAYSLQMHQDLQPKVYSAGAR